MKTPLLLIEDDQWLADSYMLILTARGYEVTHFSTAHEAMRWIDAHPVSLIIADILLGEGNTLTLLHELQSYADTAQIPVVVCTNVGPEQFEGVDLASYGVVALLDKATVTPDKLLLCVESHLPERRGLES